jgi:hypothetical protein
MSAIFCGPLRDKRQGRREAGRRRAKAYNIVRDISTNGSGKWLGGAYLVKAAPREYEGERHCRQVQPKWDMRGAAILSTQNLDPKKEGKMKFLRIAALAALTAFGGIFASGGNAAPAAGLLTGAPVVRTLATPAAKVSVEKAYWHRWHRWHRYHYWHRRHYWHRYHYWRPYYRRYYWHPYYW